MRSLKTVLLGTTAGLLAVGVAQAADLPVKKAAAAVQYVEVCPVYGAGFYKLPGTDICVRHFGSVKFTFGVQDKRSAFEGQFLADGDFNFIVRDGASNTTGWQWTIRPGWDFRSPTEYGTLRTVVQLRVDQRNGIFENDDPALTGAMRTTNLIHRGYIEWAGFLIGRASSQYIYWDQDDVVTAIGGDPKTTAMQVTYVFTAPGGFKATIGLEDSSPWISSAGVFNTGITNFNTTVFAGPQRRYDIVGSVSTEQSWGNAKLSGIAHSISIARDTTNDGFPAPDTTETAWGWGALAGITFNLPWLGAKDQLLLQGTICKGAMAACGINGGAENNMTTFERSGQFLDGLQRNDPDAYIFQNADGSVTFRRSSAWSVAGQLRHYWSPMWRSNFMASYRKVEVPDAVKNGLVTGDPRGFLTGDARAWDVGANLIWGQNRKTAEIGVEVVYKSVKQDHPIYDIVPALLPLVGVDQNPSGWGVAAFIQRAW